MKKKKIKRIFFKIKVFFFSLNKIGKQFFYVIMYPKN
ncbi:hypothetical protein NEOC65_000994 [Neochlamydia sp. AcF65]|nr:hypothetical protein [Neochlamydia sp. AcF65]